MNKKDRDNYCKTKCKAYINGHCTSPKNCYYYEYKFRKINKEK